MVLNASWGGIELEDVPPHAFLVDDVPFDWLFARVRAVVHHGGSGTTHSALRFGVPQIVPHIADQHFSSNVKAWARRDSPSRTSTVASLRPPSRRCWTCRDPYLMKHLSPSGFCVSACALLSLDASAQKCKYLLDETDPMTEERVRRTKMTLEGRDFVVNYYRKADEFRVEMAVALIGERNFIVEEGTELSLKLGNGDIEVFKPPSGPPPSATWQEHKSPRTTTPPSIAPKPKWRFWPSTAFPSPASSLETRLSPVW